MEQLSKNQKSPFLTLQFIYNSFFFTKILLYFEFWSFQVYQFDNSFKVTEEMKAVYNHDGVIMVKYVSSSCDKSVW